MSVVQDDKHAPADAHTPLQIVRCCNLPLMPAVRVLRTLRVRPVRFTCACTVLLFDERRWHRNSNRVMPGYAGLSDGRHTHRNTHTLSYILSALLSASFFTVLFSLTSHSLPSWHR